MTNGHECTVIELGLFKIARWTLTSDSSSTEKTPRICGVDVEQCSICLETMTTPCILTPCEHTFDLLCLTKWMHTQSPSIPMGFTLQGVDIRYLHCPMCRQSFTGVAELLPQDDSYGYMNLVSTIYQYHIIDTDWTLRIERGCPNRIVYDLDASVRPVTIVELLARNDATLRQPVPGQETLTLDRATHRLLRRSQGLASDEVWLFVKLIHTLMRLNMSDDELRTTNMQPFVDRGAALR